MSSKLSILGSTGSIGVSALRVLRSIKHDFEIQGLSCHSNLELFEKQLSEFRPLFAAVASEKSAVSQEYKDLKKKFPDITFFEGEDSVLELVHLKTDVVVSAISGAAGLMPTLGSLANVKRLALANKESLVMAGDIVLKKVREHKVELLPIDSEHSAIFQILSNRDRAGIKRVILTASGGSMRNKSIDEMENVSPEEALIHPTWNMGNKITIDSATLMNKGLEVIETHYLFNIDYDLISVIIHPESIIHSMVETNDGAIYAYMSAPDMAHPIAAALFYPKVQKNPFGTLNLTEIQKLEFFEYDAEKFPGLKMCYSAGREGGTMPAALNAANEIAVYSFLEKKIKFTDIVKVVEMTINKHNVINNPDITDILSVDNWARETAKGIIRNFQ